MLELVPYKVEPVGFKGCYFVFASTTSQRGIFVIKDPCVKETTHGQCQGECCG